MAPFMPFTAEYIYKELNGNLESVHLEDWPEVRKELIDQKVLDYMQITRKIVELGLAERAEKNIKVRQPLSELRIKNQELSQEYLDLIKDEVNVKEVVCEKVTGDLAVKLDLEITPELIQEGLLRELVRTINGMRKNAGLTIGDRIKIEYFTDNLELKSVFEKFGEELKKQTLTDEVLEKDGGDEIKVNGIDIKLKIVK
jgi:isoleucyl-tRNA synthetase